MKVRQDAWSHEDDLLLAETVLRYIRDGGTQLAAFDEVGDKLNRTSAACGFRWNAEVRNNYEQAIAIAKKQRKERKRALERMTKEKEVVPHTVETKSESAFVPEEPPTVIEEYSTELVPTSKSTTLEDCISFLSSLRRNDLLSQQLENENKRLRRENDMLLTKNKELEKRLEKLSNQQTIIQEDYQALVQIMDRARRLVMFEESEDRNAPTFRMDKNGNLEQVAK